MEKHLRMQKVRVSTAFRSCIRFLIVFGKLFEGAQRADKRILLLEPAGLEPNKNSRLIAVRGSRSVWESNFLGQNGERSPSGGECSLNV